MTEILANTFRGSVLRELTLPDSLTSIANSAHLGTLLDSYNHCGTDLFLNIPANCLNPTKAIPTPTPTSSPIMKVVTPTSTSIAISKATPKKTVTCIRAKSIKKVTGVKPVCPKGYKKEVSQIKRGCLVRRKLDIGIGRGYVSL